MLPKRKQTCRQVRCLELWSATTLINLEESKEAEQDEAGQVALVFEEALVSEEPQAGLHGGKKTGRHLHPMRASILRQPWHACSVLYQTQYQ